MARHAHRNISYDAGIRIMTEGFVRDGIIDRPRLERAAEERILRMARARVFRIERPAYAAAPGRTPFTAAIGKGVSFTPEAEEHLRSLPVGDGDFAYLTYASVTRPAYPSECRDEIAGFPDVQPWMLDEMLFRQASGTLSSFPRGRFSSVLVGGTEVYVRVSEEGLRVFMPKTQAELEEGSIILFRLPLPE